MVVTKSKVCPFGDVGDELWVREDYVAWKSPGVQCATGDAAFISFRDGAVFSRDGLPVEPDGKKFQPTSYKAGRFMPRWASRIQLQICSIDKERVQAISGDDAELEGFTAQNRDLGLMYGVHGFKLVWQRLHGEDSWKKNPEVWVIEFCRLSSHGDGAKERPIVFTPVMVQALLRNQKTQTRRIV